MTKNTRGFTFIFSRSFSPDVLPHFVDLHACNLGCGLLFSLSSAWGLFLECFRFERCGALGHVVTSAFSLCGVVACVFLLFLPCLGEMVMI